MLKKILLITGCCFIFACTQESDKLIGTWQNENGNSTLQIKPGSLGINYSIIVTGENATLNQNCKTIVLYSNHGFNCYGFPDKTARIMYQSNLQPESDVLVVASDRDDEVTSYRKIN